MIFYDLDSISSSCNPALQRPVLEKSELSCDSRTLFFIVKEYTTVFNCLEILLALAPFFELDYSSIRRMESLGVVVWPSAQPSSIVRLCAGLDSQQMRFAISIMLTTATLVIEIVRSVLMLAAPVGAQNTGRDTHIKWEVILQNYPAVLCSRTLALY